MSYFTSRPHRPPPGAKCAVCDAPLSSSKEYNWAKPKGKGRTHFICWECLEKTKKKVKADG